MTTKTSRFINGHKPKLLDQVRHAIRLKNYAVAIDYLTRALVIAEQTIGEDIDNAIESCECCTIGGGAPFGWQL